MSTKGWREAFNELGKTVVDAIRGTLATSLLPGSMTAADFKKLTGIVPGLFAVPTPFTSEFDYTVPQVIQLIPPMPAKLTFGFSARLLITVKNGTVTTGPFVKLGTNATNDNITANAVQAGIATQGVDTSVSLVVVSPVPANLDLTATGLRFEITTGAVLGTATALKGRLTSISMPIVEVY